MWLLTTSPASVSTWRWLGISFDLLNFASVTVCVCYSSSRHVHVKGDLTRSFVLDPLELSGLCAIVRFPLWLTSSSTHLVSLNFSGSFEEQAAVREITCNLTFLWILLMLNIYTVQYRACFMALETMKPTQISCWKNMDWQYCSDLLLVGLLVEFKKKAICNLSFSVPVLAGSLFTVCMQEHRLKTTGGNCY